MKQTRLSPIAAEWKVMERLPVEKRGIVLILKAQGNNWTGESRHGINATVTAWCNKGDNVRRSRNTRTLGTFRTPAGLAESWSPANLHTQCTPSRSMRDLECYFQNARNHKLLIDLLSGIANVMANRCKTRMDGSASNLNVYYSMAEVGVQALLAGSRSIYQLEKYADAPRQAVLVGA
ncbi:hypothetical protein J6590_005908 [Homalodisca vitripennis]|nr:hypothetical protein J6590_005908 [Homalodisca vitripennis]